MAQFRVSDDSHRRVQSGLQRTTTAEDYGLTEVLSAEQAVRDGRMALVGSQRPYASNLQTLGSTNQVFFGRNNDLWHIAFGISRTWQFDVHLAAGGVGLLSFGEPWNTFNYGYDLRANNDGSVTWRGYWGGAFQNTSVSGLLNFGAWNTICINTTTSRATNVFVNGVGATSGTLGGSVTTGAGLLGWRFGYDSPGPNGYLRNFYAVKYQDNPPNSFAGPLDVSEAYIPMNDGAGTKAYDVWNPSVDRYIEFNSVSWIPDPG